MTDVDPKPIAEHAMPSSAPEQGEAPSSTPTLRQATTVWAYIGCLSFGGPAAQIALMHREVVEEQRWIAERDYLDALSFCMLLPGPEAMQLATYIGWCLHGTLGGLVAGLLFVLPGAVVIAGLAALYVHVGDVAVVQALFLGVKAAVLVIVVEALLRVARRTLGSVERWAIAGLAFVALFAFDVPYPVVIGAAGLWGALRVWSAGDGSNISSTSDPLPITRTLRTVAIWLVIWWAPLLALDIVLPGSILGEVGRFFSLLATVTFGGAYAVLAFMAQEAVAGYGWLTASEMADALGLAETTPGPLVLVTEFVGFLAGARAGGGVDLPMGFAAAIVALWATFTPCFLWVFAGAPLIDRLRSLPRLKGVVDAIGAAVVGVILNLSVWFALQVGFEDVARASLGPLRAWWPDVATLDWRVPAIAVIAGVFLLRRHWSIPATLVVSALAGLTLSAITV